MRGVSLRFGGLAVLSTVDLTVRAGEIHGLVGPNGAGKTSLFNCISGLYRPQAGSINLDGADLLRCPPHRLAGLGLARTFQHPILDQHTSVLENVLTGTYTCQDSAAVGRVFHPRSALREKDRRRQKARALLAYSGLIDVEDQSPGTLPHAEQKRVELVRALLAEPKLLLLDEPAGGLVHSEVDELGELIRRIRDDHGVTVLLVEHHMGLISSITDHVHVLAEGRNVTAGTAAEVQRHPAVIESYLGSAP
ncbi:ABC transporter ATP-binding protein [Parafrankia sp. EUN1f]|uniref:ABC transporter ATP-binding protein n=1 Tax=Parafrankia sp. EUN1f TaxID=102897 RepID=UPI0018DB5C7B|nr:ABC transporter ATP-binding protein [Parafrankia sp. EUN1f]